MGGEGLEIRADLVAHITTTGGAIRAHDHRIHLAVLHQMATGVVDDHGVGNPFPPELIGGERRALVARSGLIDPDMHVQTSAVGLVNRCQGRTPVDCGQPPGIAMGEHIERLALPLRRPGGGQLLKDLEAVISDGGAHGHIFIGDRCRFLPGRCGPLFGRQRLHQLPHPLQRPTQIHRRGPRGIQLFKRIRQSSIRWVVLQRQHQAIGTGDPDQWRSPHHHGANGLSGLRTAAQGSRCKAMGQQGLINHAHRAAVGLEPNRAPGLAINLHRLRISEE